MSKGPIVQPRYEVATRFFPTSSHTRAHTQWPFHLFSCSSCSLPNAALLFWPQRTLGCPSSLWEARYGVSLAPQMLGKTMPKAFAMSATPLLYLQMYPHINHCKIPRLLVNPLIAHVDCGQPNTFHTINRMLRTHGHEVVLFQRSLPFLFYLAQSKMSNLAKLYIVMKTGFPFQGEM